MKFIKLTVETCARLAHEINRAYCAALGDNSQKPWKEAEEWQRQSAIKGAEFTLNHITDGPDAQHNAWMADKLKDGWKYGPVKDPAKKEHPCIVPYDQLPGEQRSKDYLFRGAVLGVADLAIEDHLCEQTTEGHAGRLYETYCKAVGGVAFDGKPLPTWEEFSKDPKKQKQADGWRAVALAAGYGAAEEKPSL